jgi:PAS domain S-box-containing protein/diguanylate cyclase (GGDEF)-like protein
MDFSTPHLDSAMKRFFSFLATLYTLRYGVAAIILTTVGYSLVEFLPMIRRDLQLMHDAYSVQVRGIRLEGDMQLQMQQGRRDFLRALLATGTHEDPTGKIASMHTNDAAIVLSEARLNQLAGDTRTYQQQFHGRWEQYKAQRDKLLAAALHAGPGAAAKLDAGLATDAFVPAEQSVQSAEVALEASVAGKIREASRALGAAKTELLVVIVVKLAIVCLIFWMDWTRIRTERLLRRANRELRASEDGFRQAFESAEVGMGIFALDGTVLSVNRAGARILGYKVSELVGTKVKDFMAPEFREDHLQRIATLPTSTDKSYVAERRVMRKDGTAAWVRNSVTLMKPEGEEGYYFSISEEITLQKEANDRLTYLANYDPVTNLPNRRFFEEQLAAALQTAPGQSTGVALLYLEIDSFDFVKGTFGRLVADEILGELGKQLAAFQAEGELIARLDDYVFGMLAGAAPYDEATLIRAGELRAIFHRASETGKHRIPISASIGIAYSTGTAASTATGYPTPLAAGQGSATPTEHADILLKYARAAMFEARSRGGDSIFLADPALQERAAQRHRIESALLRGLRQDEFRVVFQPQFEIATGKLVRFEALCRWNSTELGHIPPDRFIPIAEQTGLISEIGRRIMHEALLQAKSWIESGRRIGVAVNISPMQFMRPDFTQAITEVLALTQFPAALLELEITEGIFIRDLNLAVARIRELQRLGLSIALDDFGTGYSSLSYLQRMPIDAVKLDRSFVRDITTDPATVSMVRSVLAMAEALNLRVVTEGVETEEQLDILRTLGCDEAQGYLLGRPESAEMALRRVLDSPLQYVGTLV